MKNLLNNLKVFIQTPLFIAIVVGVLVLSGVGYFGVKEYKNYQTQKENAAEIDRQEQNKKNSDEQIRNAEIESLKKEIEDLKKSQSITENSQEKKQQSLPQITTQWEWRVVRIVCNWGTTFLSGSGTYLGEYKVVTNKHVVYGNPDGLGERMADSCMLAFPDDHGSDKIMTISISDILPADTSVYTDFDYATINLSGVANSYLKGVNKNHALMCHYNVEKGEQVLILGYPGVGAVAPGMTELDVTASDGIISGEDGPYWVTTAKIEHGDSGGAAISVKNNCYLGIPTFALVGEIESLSRILKFPWLVPNY